MNTFFDDRYLVFVRGDRSHITSPEEFEKYLTTCPTYEEARRLQREFRSSCDGEIVIRYLGPAGGGD
jgi:hypothetical protein